MALGDPYVTLAEYRAWRKVPDGNTTLDALMNSILQSASDEIETHCNRQFNKTTTATGRIYPIRYGNTIPVDDFWTTDGLIIQYDQHGDGITTTDVTQYRLEPLNGIVDGQVGWPYNRVVPRSGSKVGGFLRVTAKWGWDVVPDSVKQATLIMAGEMYQSKDAPLGVAGYGEFGAIRIKSNPLAERALKKFVRNSLKVR